MILERQQFNDITIYWSLMNVQPLQSVMPRLVIRFLETRTQCLSSLPSEQPGLLKHLFISISPNVSFALPFRKHHRTLSLFYSQSIIHFCMHQNIITSYQTMSYNQAVASLHEFHYVDSEAYISQRSPICAYSSLYVPINVLITLYLAMLYFFRHINTYLLFHQLFQLRTYDFWHGVEEVIGQLHINNSFVVKYNTVVMFLLE